MMKVTVKLVMVLLLLNDSPAFQSLAESSLAELLPCVGGWKNITYNVSSSWA